MFVCLVLIGLTSDVVSVYSGCAVSTPTPPLSNPYLSLHSPSPHLLPPLYTHSRKQSYPMQILHSDGMPEEIPPSRYVPFI